MISMTSSKTVTNIAIWSVPLPNSWRSDSSATPLLICLLNFFTSHVLSLLLLLNRIRACVTDSSAFWRAVSSG